MSLFICGDDFRLIGKLNDASAHVPTCFIFRFLCNIVYIRGNCYFFFNVRRFSFFDGRNILIDEYTLPRFRTWLTNIQLPWKSIGYQSGVMFFHVLFIFVSGKEN